MTLSSSADVSIDGVDYVLAREQQPHYVHRYESLFANATAIAGEVAKQQLRPEKLLWSLTDFSGGEGSSIFYSQSPTAYDIGSGVNVTQAGLLTTRPRRYVSQVARSGSTATTGMRPAGGSTWNKSVILWGDNGLFSRDALGWTAGTGSSTMSGTNLFDADSDGRYIVSGTVVDGPTSGNALISTDGVPATPTYADIFSGTTVLDAPFVTEVLDGVWYAWGINAAVGVLALIKGGALSTTSAGSMVYNSLLVPQGAWGSNYWTDIEAAEGNLFMSFGTPAGSIVYTSEADVGRTYYTSEPGFCIKKLVYKAGVLFCLGAQVSAGKRFASVWAIPLQTASPIDLGSPRKHRNTELYSWEAACAGPGSLVFMADCISGKIFVYDMKRDSFSLFDDLVNGGTGDGMSFVPSGNLLPYATSTMETATIALTGWTEVQASVTLGVANPHNGNKSLFFTGGGGVSVTTATGVAGVFVVGDTSYTASAYTYVSSGAIGSWTIAIKWYDSTGSLISTSTGSPTTGPVGAWTLASNTATSPSNAIYAALVITNANGSNAYVDDVSFGSGSGTDQIAFIAMHGSRLFGATWEPTGVGTSLQVFAYDDLLKEQRDASQAISGSLESAQWDYGVPQETKALIGFYVTYEVTDPSTESGLLDHSRIAISYATDEEIDLQPAYIALDPIESTTEVTHKGRHFIQVSDGTDTVKFSRLKVKITLDNDGIAIAPPILYSVVVEAQLLAYAETWDLALRIEDEAQNDRPKSRANDASFLRDNLLGLVTNKNIVTFLDGTRYRQKHEGFTEHIVMLEDPTDYIDDDAEGFMRIRLRSVPV